ncbi:MAG: hypothetical protein APF76_14415 [Desulfitibacter sp. BRH_c19]|nr:MAG: hypothetical protein APF76_14415 [Desulfitibacter sp. BRH_c19]
MAIKNLKDKKSQTLILLLVGIVLLGFLGTYFYRNILDEDNKLNFSELMENNGKYTIVFIYTDPTPEKV